ncbi:hypothetical protein Syun_006983 [Stephania yunnanensis]|uniref:Uncharacterized protein n=1 Tax=Stephania yunnanensis TaxID=152371 RepID=A0AAP0PY30_9MAGN
MVQAWFEQRRNRRDGRDGEMVEDSSVNDGEMAEVRAPASARAVTLARVTAFNSVERGGGAKITEDQRWRDQR